MFEPKPKGIGYIVTCSYLCFHFVHCMEAGVANIEALDQPLICGDFDSKLEHLK